MTATTNIWLRLRWLLWLWTVVLTTVFSSSATVDYDGQSQAPVAHDISGESVSGYDAVSVLSTSEKKNGTAVGCILFVKFAEFVAAESAPNGIFNRGGRFADLDAARLDGEVGHHMEQNAYNRSIGVTRADGPSIGMTTEDHALTRTFAGRGRATLAEDVGLNARQRMVKDIWDLRALFGTKYSQGALEAIDYAKTLPAYSK